MTDPAGGASISEIDGLDRTHRAPPPAEPYPVIALHPGWIIGGLIGALLGGLVIPRVAATPGLWAAVIGAAAAAAIGVALSHRRDRRLGRSLVIERVIRRPHWVQLAMHLAVFLYWGAHWEQVAVQAPLIVLQVPFAYLCDLLAAWWRYGRWRLGFGPWPVVGSTNLFLWWHDEWFIAQFAMIAIIYASRALIRWRRGGRLVHIFNPSALGLALSAAVMVGLEVAHLTWGASIAQSLGRPPYAYPWIFATGLVVMLLFRVTPITLGAAIALLGADALHRQLTGVSMYLDTAIPIAVFLGMNLLITDPATSPRRAGGKLIFGALYGLSVFALYPLLTEMSRPPSGLDPGLHVTFLDKLLPVPLLNLSVRRIDAISDALAERLGDLIGRLPRAVSALGDNPAHVALWALLFAGVHGELRGHPGRAVSFWEAACTEQRPRGCETLLTAYGRGCIGGLSEACYRLGVVLSDDPRLPSDLPRAVAAYDRGCALGFAPACAQVGAMLMLGRGLPADPLTGRWVLGRACERGQLDACVALGEALRVGLGAPADPIAARRPLRMGCDGGDARGCAELAQALTAPVDPRLAEARGAAESACSAAEPTGCLVLGLLLEQTSSSAVDRARAVERFAAACDGGVARACTVHAERLRLGRGVSADPARARAQYEAACGRGDPIGCEDGARMLWVGDGVPADRRAARRLLERGCALGRDSACTRLTTLAP